MRRVRGYVKMAGYLVVRLLRVLWCRLVHAEHHGAAEALYVKRYIPAKQRNAPGYNEARGVGNVFYCPKCGAWFVGLNSDEVSASGRLPGVRP